MSRLISFWLLVAVIVILVIVFFRVMSSFLLPLFLAAVVVVIFNPMNRKILDKLKGRRHIAATITTVVAMSIVLIPTLLLVTFAALESRHLVRQLDSATMVTKAKEMRSRLGLDLPHAVELRQLDSLIQSAMQKVATFAEVDESAIELLSVDLHQLERESNKFVAEKLELKWEGEPTANSTDQTQLLVHEYALALKQLRDATASLNTADSTEVQEITVQIAALNRNWLELKYHLMGGRLAAMAKDLVNPTQKKVDEYASTTVEWLQSNMVSFGSATVEYVVRLIIGIVIMVVSVYFFLLDGPRMISTIKRLSPLDDRYEDELIGEFDQVSRAVVLASLISAVVQGILAGIAYWIAGLDAVFLLTLMTMMFALIPILGTSLVWVPCCAYLYFFEGRLAAAVLLGIYCIIVVSQIDNLIKPLVLHGQSKIHPLMALLSIFGGVATLGPIGILVGPMLVAFLQSLLAILQREMSQMDDSSQSPAPS